MRVKFLILFLAITSGIKAQVSQFNITSSDNLAFKIIVNGEFLSDTFTSSYTSPFLRTGSYKTALTFENDTISDLMSNLYLPDQSLFSYKLKKTQKEDGKWKYKLSLNFQEELEVPKEILDSLENIPNENKKENLSTSVTPDLLNNGFSPSLYKGKRGCEFPISENNFQSIHNKVRKEIFESKKLSVAKKELQAVCVSIDQIKMVMDLFEFEDHKLEFAKFALNSLFDISNVEQIFSNFEFSNSKQEFREYLNKKNI